MGGNFREARVFPSLFNPHEKERTTRHVRFSYASAYFTSVNKREILRMLCVCCLARVISWRESPCVHSCAHLTSKM